jgi:hypothetical protein
MASSGAREPAPLSWIRPSTLALVALGTVGMSVELVVAAVGLVTIATVAVRPRAGLIRLLQFVMLTYAGTGIIGIALHYQANAEFQREIDPALGGLALFWKVVEATAPPALAPGVMVQLGLLGLVYTYKHPALGEQEFGGAGQGDA